LKKNAVLNGKTGEEKEVEIVGKLPLTILIDGHKIVTLMTLGIYQDLLVLEYLRNQCLITDKTFYSLLEFPCEQ